MRTITFYSYKGGVGRSLALANVATRLMEFGKKVCLLDFDLEAPGLHFKFPSIINSKINKGIVDYIYDFTNQGILREKISDYSIPIGRKNPIYLIPAGNIDSLDYWRKLSSINWYDFLYESNNGLEFFLDLKEKIQNEFNPDYLLIDSRTGISEISGITISLLANEVVMVAANNRENLTGIKKIIANVTNPKNSILGEVPKITFVLSRIPFTDNPDDKAKEQILIGKTKKELYDFKIGDINVIHSDRELEEKERIKIGYSKDESTAQISKDYLNLFEKLTENDLSEEEIMRFHDFKTLRRTISKGYF